MTFYNLTCRKPNGDFYITSSDVVKDSRPNLSHAGVIAALMQIAAIKVAEGFNVELTQCEC